MKNKKKAPMSTMEAYTNIKEGLAVYQLMKGALMKEKAELLAKGGSEPNYFSDLCVALDHMERAYNYFHYFQNVFEKFILKESK